MTLESVPRYDPARVDACGDHAVVVGASVAGLLAGRVLADAFDDVTILERDPATGTGDPRRGIPQGKHVHVLLEAGRATLEDLFPGYSETLVGRGGLSIDLGRDLGYYQKGGYLADPPERLPMYCATRPLFERVVRDGVTALDGVTLRPGCRCLDYRTDRRGRTVDGVVVGGRAGETETVDADLVVDATGRTSRTPRWLDRHGYDSPAVERVCVDLVYATTLVERPPDDRQGYLVVPSPATPRGGAAIPVEDDRWIVTLFGLHGDHPPADPTGFEAFAGSLPTGALAHLLDAHRWTDGTVRRYPFPATRRRRYEDLDRFPSGLVVTGDAVASFNPIYGQGMSVAALDALHLHHALAAGGRANLAPRFFDRVGSVVDTVWRITVCSDFAFERTTGPKPRGTDAVNRYLSRLVRTAQADGRVAERYLRVLRLERPPTALVTPEVLGRVLLPTRTPRSRPN
ncbi:NAD(P)/FAD-dependent oxidoreductase [Candidatus Halobonum tyrrellensis]|uniref:2-polyprenyl-6-methoxyphenol hydroxylase-like oxidoreductase n=1 Tax=Candidatus Halobonum tyrrellensis G22 TaxID=1324957 RepID=V4HHK7_9EURY|nr:FAD-dependent monooxygenase [Candidatus Halobonum tyrrellensis]ESP87344.1 2-polyprenyl-6-methoxyphenol hydroxylase-like oxidoreductase [Candidatus Halobonum tyrrellensis G22]